MQHPCQRYDARSSATQWAKADSVASQMGSMRDLGNPHLEDEPLLPQCGATLAHHAPVQRATVGHRKNHVHDLSGFDHFDLAFEPPEEQESAAGGEMPLTL